MNGKEGRAKHYTLEFKEEAVARCNEIGTTRTSEELGIPTGTLNRWKHELEKKGKHSGKS